MTARFLLPIFSDALADHLQQEPPPFLYHYTSQDGLLRIINSGSLWATNVSYMNDVTELDLLLNLIKTNLRTREKGAGARLRRRLVAVIVGLLVRKTISTALQS